MQCLYILDLDSTTQQTSTASGDETDFLSGNCRTGDGRGFSDMLVVTTTVRMVNRIHSNTASTGPAVNDILLSPAVDECTGWLRTYNA